MSHYIVQVENCGIHVTCFETSWLQPKDEVNHKCFRASVPDYKRGVLVTLNILVE